MIALVLSYNCVKEVMIRGQPIDIRFSLVAEMSELLSPGKHSRVLEIGTGSGYQTAILARFSGHVYTVERIPELALLAHKKLDALRFVEMKGKYGWSGTV